MILNIQRKMKMLLTLLILLGGTWQAIAQSKSYGFSGFGEGCAALNNENSPWKVSHGIPEVKSYNEQVGVLRASKIQKYRTVNVYDENGKLTGTTQVPDGFEFKSDGIILTHTPAFKRQNNYNIYMYVKKISNTNLGYKLYSTKDFAVSTSSCLGKEALLDVPNSSKELLKNQEFVPSTNFGAYAEETIVKNWTPSVGFNKLWLHSYKGSSDEVEESTFYISHIEIEEWVYDATPPSVPSGLTISLVNQTAINISWAASSDNKPDGITYEVYQGNQKIATTSNLNHSVSSLNGCTSYTYKVRAIDNRGNVSAFSNSVNYVTGKDVPPHVVLSSDLSNTVVYTQEAIKIDLLPGFKFKASSNAHKLHLMGGNECVVTNNARKGEFVEEQFIEEQFNYDYDFGYIPEEATSVLDVNVFPIPAQKYIKVITKEATRKYQLLTMDLSIIRESDVHDTNYTIEIGDLKQGVYLLQIEGEDGFVKMSKFIKQ